MAILRIFHGFGTAGSAHSAIVKRYCTNHCKKNVVCYDSHYSQNENVKENFDCSVFWGLNKSGSKGEKSD